MSLIWRKLSVVIKVMVLPMKAPFKMLYLWILFSFKPAFPCGLWGERLGFLVNLRGSLGQRRSADRAATEVTSSFTQRLFEKRKNGHLSYLINPRSLWSVNIFFVKPWDLSYFQPAGLYFCLSFCSLCSWPFCNALLDDLFAQDFFPPNSWSIRNFLPYQFSRDWPSIP